MSMENRLARLLIEGQTLKTFGQPDLTVMAAIARIPNIKEIRIIVSDKPVKNPEIKIIN